MAAAVCLVGSPAGAQAPAERDQPVPMATAQYGGPQHIAGGLTVIFPFGRAESDDNLKRQKAFALQGTAGLGGFRAAAGIAWLTGPFGPDALLTVTRTTSRARGADPHQTYVGIEAGFLWVVVRPTVGVAWRVSGPDGRRRTGVHWGVSVVVPFSWW